MIYLGYPEGSTEPVRAVHSAIEAWMRSDSLLDLVRAFGDDMPSQLDLVEANLWLQDFSARWDYRGMQHPGVKDRGLSPAERWSIEEDCGLTDKQAMQVAAACDTLGLTGMDTPRESDYDFIVVLGGARMSNLLRSRHVARLIDSAAVSTGTVVLLSCMRPVADAERAATNTYAPDARTEYDLLNSGAEYSFSFLRDYREDVYTSCESGNLNWAVRCYEPSPRHPQAISLAAPSSHPNARRANSADAFSFFMSRCGTKPADSVLIVTSQMYVPYQQMEALRILAIPSGLKVETIGHPSELAGNSTGGRQWSSYLQEIRSTILSMGRFLEQYPPGSTSPQLLGEVP